MKNKTQASAKQKNLLIKIHYSVLDGRHEYPLSFFTHVRKMNRTITYHRIAHLYSQETPERKEIFLSLRYNGKAGINGGTRTIADVTYEFIPPIEVIVAGGEIRDVRYIPQETVVRVLNYDKRATPDCMECINSVVYWTGESNYAS